MSLKSLSLALSALMLACNPVWADETAAGNQDTTEPEVRQELPLDALKRFADVFNQIRQGYVKEIPQSELMDYAIRGMMSNLDPHSAYLNKEAFSDLQDSTSGEFGGIGIEVGKEMGLSRLSRPSMTPPRRTPVCKAETSS